MPATLISPPAVEPVSLAEAKAHLRIDDDAEDALLAATLRVAREYVERAARRALITQAWRVFLDTWPKGWATDIRPAPLIGVQSVVIFGAGGEETTVDPDLYEVDAVSVPARLAIKGNPPRPCRRLNGIAIDVVAGYGEAATDVPAPLRHAVLMLAAHWYENRGVARERIELVPLGVEALLAPYRVPGL